MSEVIEANIHVHTALAQVYNKDEPHFRAENKEKVQKRLQDLKERTNGEFLLDLGCGTGFIIDLARPYFSSISGVDITPAMLEKVDTSDHDIKLYNCSVEQLPFENETYSAASAYSFLDHLEDQGKMLKEAYRVLKPGGVLYIDLVPNYFYWTSLENEQYYSELDLSDFVQREYTMVTDNDKIVEKKYGIDAQIFRTAEPAKIGRGVNPFEFRKLAISCGFSSCQIKFDWFLGNAKVLHKQSKADADLVQKFLVESLPLSKGMFKYVWFLLRKPSDAK